MATQTDGYPVSITYAMLLNHEKDVDDYGEPILTLFFLCDQRLPKANKTLSFEFLTEENDDFEEVNFSLKFKLKGKKKIDELAKKLEVGKGYLIQYAVGTRTLAIEGKGIQYQDFYLLRKPTEISRESWDKVLRLGSSGQSQNQQAA